MPTYRNFFGENLKKSLGSFQQLIWGKFKQKNTPIFGECFFKKFAVC
jgi:hypothetical protein